MQRLQRSVGLSPGIKILAYNDNDNDNDDDDNYNDDYREKCLTVPQQSCKERLQIILISDNNSQHNFG